MPSASTHAYPAYTTAVANQPYKSNGATVLYGGNINLASRYPGPNVSQALGTTELGYRSGTNGALIPGPFTPTPGRNHECVTNAIAGRYAGMTAKQYQILGFSTVIAGNASTVMASPGADYGRLPYPAFVKGIIRTQKIVTTGGWVYQTGKPVNQTQQNDTEGSEAFPARATPSRLTYLYTGKLATVVAYKAKTD